MPVGGGGLVAGIAAYVKAVRPDIKIIGVEPTGAQQMRRPRTAIGSCEVEWCLKGVLGLSCLAEFLHATAVLRDGIRNAAGANAMAISLMRGRRTTLGKVDAFADGVAVKTVRDTGVCQ